MATKSIPTDIDKYISQFAPEAQRMLEQLRSIIKKCAPNAEEGISYGIPAFYLNGSPFVYIGGAKNHVSIYPAPRQAESFKKILSAYKGGKGTVQFPLSTRIPVGLVTKIVKYRIAQQMEKARKVPKRVLRK